MAIFRSQDRQTQRVSSCRASHCALGKWTPDHTRKLLWSSYTQRTHTSYSPLSQYEVLSVCRSHASRWLYLCPLDHSSSLGVQHHSSTPQVGPQKSSSNGTFGFLLWIFQGTLWRVSKHVWHPRWSKQICCHSAFQRRCTHRLLAQSGTTRFATDGTLSAVCRILWKGRVGSIWRNRWRSVWLS